jgi:ABC-type oligopeptide transport system substrate-binding subunit
MKAMRYRAALALILVMLASPLGACSRDLFSDSDNRTQRTLRYYDNDSATNTTNQRKQSVGSPFGMPQGSAEQ